MELKFETTTLELDTDTTAFHKIDAEELADLIAKSGFMEAAEKAGADPAAALDAAMASPDAAAALLDGQGEEAFATIAGALGADGFDTGFGEDTGEGFPGTDGHDFQDDGSDGDTSAGIPLFGGDDSDGGDDDTSAGIQLFGGDDTEGGGQTSRGIQLFGGDGTDDDYGPMKIWSTQDIIDAQDSGSETANDVVEKATGMTGGDDAGGETGGDDTGGETGGETGGDDTGGETGGDDTGGETGGDDTGGETGGDDEPPATGDEESQSGTPDSTPQDDDYGIDTGFGPDLPGDDPAAGGCEDDTFVFVDFDAEIDTLDPLILTDPDSTPTPVMLDAPTLDPLINPGVEDSADYIEPMDAFFG